MSFNLSELKVSSCGIFKSTLWFGLTGGSCRLVLTDEHQSIPNSKCATTSNPTQSTKLVSSEEQALPRLIRCELSRLRCHGHSLLLPSYLCRIKRKENSSCGSCGHHLQNMTHLFLDCPHPSLSDASTLALLLPFFTSNPDLGAWPDCWVSVEFLYVPIPRKGSGSTTTTTNSDVAKPLSYKTKTT